MGGLGELGVDHRLPRLVGRDRFVSEVVFGASSNSHPPGRLYLVTGDGGTGRTALLARVLPRLDGVVASASAGEHDSSEPLGAWRQVLCSLLTAQALSPSDVPELMPWLRRERPAPTLPALLHWCSLLRTVTEHRPIVIAIDDLHLLGPESTVVFDALLGEICRAAVTVVATVSTRLATDEQRRWLRSWYGHPHTEVLRLTALTDQEVAEIVSSHFSQLDPDHAALVVELACGNPGAAVDLCTALGRGAPGAALSRFVHRRLAGSEAEDVAAILALLGRPATVTELALIARVPLHVAEEHVDRLAAERLVASIGDPLRRCELRAPLGAAIAADLAAPRRRALHARIAEALGSRADRVGDPISQLIEVAGHLVAARRTDAAATAAYRTAAAHLESTGRLQEASALLASAVALHGDDAPLELRRDRARILSTLGHVDEALASLRHADESPPAGASSNSRDLDDLDSELDGLRDADGSLRSELLVLRAKASSLRAPELAMRNASAAAELARRTGNRPALAAALLEIGNGMKVDEGGHHQQRLVETLRSIGGPQAALYATQLRAGRIWREGHRYEVATWLTEFSACLDLYPIPYWSAYAALMRAYVAVNDADRSELSAAIDDVIAASRSRDSGEFLLLGPALVVWGVHTGEDLGFDPAALPQGDLAPHLRQLWELSFSLVRAVRQPSSAALEAVRRSMIDPSSVPEDNAWCAWLCTLALAAAMTGDVPRAEQAADALSPFVDEWGTLCPQAGFGPVGCFVAPALAVAGRLDEAGRAAEAGLRAARRHLAAGWTIRGLLEVLELSSRDPLRRAKLRIELMGHLDRQRFEPLPFDRRILATPAPGPERDLVVLGLAATGLSNKQIAVRIAVSEKTVERIFTSLFRWLGTRNRSEAVVRFLADELPKTVPGTSVETPG